MKIVFFGTPQFAVPSLEKFIHHPDINVDAVVTQPDKKRGRGSKLIPSPIKTVALQHNIPIFHPSRIKKDRSTLDQLKQISADAFIVVAYGQILSQEILDMPRLGCINGHGSILPKYRGAAPIQWCLYNGESETGITTMLMDAGMDTGPMLKLATAPIYLLDNSISLAETLSQLTADLLINTLDALDKNSITPTPQDNDQATYAPLIKKEDFALDWSRTAIALHNQIRGFYPNCLTTLRGQTLKVKSSIPLDLLDHIPSSKQTESLKSLNIDALCSSDQSKSVGKVVEIIKNQGPVIQTGDGLLLLSEVQLAGKRNQSGWDFANGTRLEVGEILNSETLN